MPKGVEKKSEKRPAFRFVFEDFLVTKLQAQYRIVTEPCGPLLTGMGTVAGRPKAIGYIYIYIYILVRLENGPHE